jgi:hypothetical protein
MRTVKAPTRPATAASTYNGPVSHLVELLAKARVRQQANPANDKLQAAKTPQETQDPAASIDRNELAAELEDLFVAMAIASDDDTKVWNELSAETLDHKTLAAGFQKMSRAKDPLSQNLCVGEYRAALQRKFTLHWSSKARRESGDAPPSVDLLEWDRLSHEEQSRIRAMCGDLEAYHRGFVRRQRPLKNALNAVLLQLAELFLHYTGQNARGTLDLPAADDGHFIAFCHAALAPLSGRGGAFAFSEVTVEALSRRWGRLKKAGRKPTLLRFDALARRVSLKRKKRHKAK